MKKKGGGRGGDGRKGREGGKIRRGGKKGGKRRVGEGPPPCVGMGPRMANPALKLWKTVLSRNGEESFKNPYVSIQTR